MSRNCHNQHHPKTLGWTIHGNTFVNQRTQDSKIMEEKGEKEKKEKKSVVVYL